MGPGNIIDGTAAAIRLSRALEAGQAAQKAAETTPQAEWEQPVTKREPVPELHVTVRLPLSLVLEILKGVTIGN